MTYTRRSVLTATTLAAFGAACSRKRASGFPGFAYVANYEGSALAVVSLTAFAVTRYVPLGAPPTQVFAHPRTGQVLALTPGSRKLHFLDPADSRIVRSTSLPGNTSQMRFTGDPAASALFLLDPPAGRLWKASPQSGALHYAAHFPEPFDFFDTANWTGLAVAGHATSGKFSIFEQASGKILGTYETGGPISALAFRSDGRQVWVAHPDTRQLSGFVATNGRLVARLPVALTPDTMYPGPDGGSIFVTGPDRDALVILEPYPAQIATTLTLGPRPSVMAASSDPPYLFVASRTAAQVSVVDMQLRRPIAVVSVANRPGFITLTPDDQYALVLNPDSGEMAVIRTTGIRMQRQKTAALFTIIPVGSRPVGADVVIA